MILFRRSVALVAAAGFLASCVSASLATTGRVRSVNERSFPGGELSIVTINMLHGFSDRVNDRTLDDRLVMLAGELERLSPDIILLQEASVTAERRHGNVVDRLVDRLNGPVPGSPGSYNSVFFPAHGSRLIGFFEGSAVLSRYEILGVERVRYAAQTRLPPERRIAVVATIASSVGGIAVVSTHLTNVETLRRGTPVRELQSRELSVLIEGLAAERRAIIVGGDFNAPPDSETIAAIVATGAVDAWSAAPPGEDGGTALRGGLDDPEAAYGRRIDYLFVLGSDAELLETRRVFDEPGTTGASSPLRISDHAGILSRISLR